MVLIYACRWWGWRRRRCACDWGNQVQHNTCAGETYATATRTRAIDTYRKYSTLKRAVSSNSLFISIHLNGGSRRLKVSKIEPSHAGYILPDSECLFNLATEWSVGIRHRDCSFTKTGSLREIRASKVIWP